MANLTILSDETETTEATTYRTITADFGLVDEKGRKVGARAVVAVTQREGVDVYYVNVRTTRNGERFGASHPSKVVATAELAEAEAHRRFRGALQAYSKKYGA